MPQSPNPKDIDLPVDSRVAADLQQMSKAAGTSDANLLASLIWMGKKAFGREVQIRGKDEKQTLTIKSFADLDKIDRKDAPAAKAGIDDRKVAAPASAQSEPDEDEDFPEDYEDYYPRGFLDTPQAAGKVTLDEKREDTRGRLAMIYTICTFIMFILGFAVAILDAAVRGTSIIDNLTKILPLLSGIFLGSLGFVLGYYFRKLEQDQTTVQG